MAMSRVGLTTKAPVTTVFRKSTCSAYIRFYVSLSIFLFPIFAVISVTNNYKSGK